MKPASQDTETQDVNQKRFIQVLVNTLLANVTTSYLWFALTFWVYLETKSVLATSIIGGTYFLLMAIFGLVFGTIVDNHKKKQVMLASSVITLGTYAISGVIYVLLPKEQIIDWNHVVFWIFTGVVLIGAVVENMRNIALSTVVTLLVPKEGRDKANGLVGSVQGVAFVVTSVFSGLSIGILGMGWTLAIAIVLTGVALIHLAFISIPIAPIATLTRRRERIGLGPRPYLAMSSPPKINPEVVMPSTIPHISTEKSVSP